MAEVEEKKIVDQMTTSNAWESRLLAMVAARYLPVDAQKQIASKLSAVDADALVRSYATAVLDLLALIPPQPAAPQGPATQPATTQPTTEPSEVIGLPTTLPTTGPATRPTAGAIQ